MRGLSFAIILTVGFAQATFPEETLPAFDMEKEVQLASEGVALPQRFAVDTHILKLLTRAEELILASPNQEKLKHLLPLIASFKMGERALAFGKLEKPTEAATIRRLTEKIGCDSKTLCYIRQSKSKERVIEEVVLDYHLKGVHLDLAADLLLHELQHAYEMFVENDGTPATLATEIRGLKAEVFLVQGWNFKQLRKRLGGHDTTHLNRLEDMQKAYQKKGDAGLKDFIGPINGSKLKSVHQLLYEENKTILKTEKKLQGLRQELAKLKAQYEKNPKPSTRKKIEATERKTAFQLEQLSAPRARRFLLKKELRRIQDGNPLSAFS